MDHTAYPRSISFGDSNVNSGNASNSYNKTINVNKVIADENPEIMQWLSPLDPRGRHQDVRTERLDGVGDWLLGTNEFREWRSYEAGADKAVLFCNGNPGVGKTYISSLVIDDLCDGPWEEDIAIAMFYCDFRSQQEQTTIKIMGGILKQLVAREEVLEDVKERFQKAKKEVGGRGLRLPDMVQMLKQAVATLPKVFICIDALDECLPKHVLELLESMKDILRESPGMRIFVTGRPQIEAEITRYFATGVTVPISPKTHDIERYLENKLKMDTEHYAMSDGLRADILRIIPERISGIFLLVSLTIDAILGEVTISARREKLSEMTKGGHLGDAYATTLDRIKAQKGARSRLGMEALMWVSNSERQLHTSELCHALGVKIGSTDLDHENIPEIRTILGCSLGLITVETSSSTIRLIHLTLQEYLSSNPSLFASPHSMIAEVCLTYLNFRCVLELSPTLSSSLSTVPLVEYASHYWGKHIRREKTESVSPLALQLLVGFEEHISSRFLWMHNYGDIYRTVRPHWNSALGFTGLHGAASFGIVETVATLLETKDWNINARDIMGQTALLGAAIGGYEDVVRILLRLEGVNPNIADTEYDRTPLGWAARGGYEGVVKALLKREDVNPSAADADYGQTPLWWAAKSGHEGIVRLLLERKDITPNTADTIYGRTPLICAVEEGHEEIVKLLLEREDINPSAASAGYSQTALRWAAQCGDERVVRMLLEREDIDPNTADTQYGRTPLVCAAEEGHEAIVKLLLEREDINPNTADTGYGRAPLWCATGGGINEVAVKMRLGRGYTDSSIAATCGGSRYGQSHSSAAGGEYERIANFLSERGDINLNTVDTEYGLTPLWWAAQHGDERVVRMLLEREDIDPNTADTQYGRTPLGWSAWGGHEGIVKLLLKREDIDPNTADTESGRTPLWWAAMHGNEGVVKLLLEREDINPNTADTEYSRTPLWMAAVIGREGIVRLLLEREDINPNTADTEHSRTPLWWAAKRGHESVVRLLLEREDISPNSSDTEYGGTPLWWAAERGDEGIVRLLLEREDVNPNTADTEHGRTPLWRAAGHGHEGVVKLLSEREDISPNSSDTEYGRTPLWLAAGRGHEGVVRLLLEREDTDPGTADTEHGRTPLWWAAGRGHEGMVRLLLEREDINPNTADTERGRTPLWWAAKRGHESVVKLLLEREDISPNSSDTEYGRTPLWWAAERGHEGIVRLLLEREDINPNTADTKYGRTPLLLAAKAGYDGVVKLLLEREDINSDIADTQYGRTPLMWAAMGGYEETIKLLLGRGDPNPDRLGLGGETALKLATSQGHAGVVHLLSEPKPPLPNSADTGDMRRKSLPTGNTLSSNKKRRFYSSDGEEQRKKRRMYLT